MDSDDDTDTNKLLLGGGDEPFRLQPLERLEGLISEINNIQAALPELVTLRNGMEILHRQNINLCVRVAMGEIVANSGTEDPVSKENRAKDAKDFEDLGESIAKLQFRLEQLSSTSAYKRLLQRKQELESDLRMESAKVQAKEEAIVDSMMIRESLERDLVRLHEDHSAASTTNVKSVKALEDRVEEVESSLDRAARKYADLDLDHGKLLEKLQGNNQSTAKWTDHKKALEAQVEILRGDKSKLETELSRLRSQSRALQAEKEDLSCQEADSELRRLRTVNSNVRSETIRLKTIVRELEDKASIAERLGPKVNEELERQKRKKNQWKEYANQLKQSLEEKEAELEKAQADNHGLATELKRIYDRAKQDAANISRLYLSHTDEAQDEAGDEGEDEAENGGEDANDTGDSCRLPALQGFKQPVYNMVVGYRDAGGPRRRVSQGNVPQDDSEMPDVALKPKSENLVPPGYSIVKEHLRKISDRTSRPKVVSSGDAGGS
ncbi:hypothetical protein ONS96_002613 [Cadophora gregata f. sp. sojae]|nr:hypothetical protein ONS96_002613 [Cadophora gregata f. sp. sojae]